MLKANAQLTESFVHTGEFGASVGLSHYFGDLNPDLSLKHPKFAAGLFYRKQFNNYISVKLAGDYAFLGYSDKYSSNPVQQLRNLSFNTNIWELSVNGEFNFFKFLPNFREFSFTPYVGIGVGIFSYDPYTYLNGEKIYLRPIGTEGQGSPLYPDRKQYGPTAICFPLTLGVKYAVNPKTNVFAEFSYRFTTTDYIDDVSTTYAPDAYPQLDANGNPTTWYLLQDRSYEYGGNIGIKGRQRGNSTQKDSYATLKVGISFNLETYRCPTF
jgi:hypothetical protein